MGSFPTDYTKQGTEIFEDATEFLVSANKILEIFDVFGGQRYLEASKVAS